MKRQLETSVGQPSAKKAKESDIHGRIVESMDVEDDLYWYLLGKSKTATRPFLRATRGHSNRRAKMTSDPTIPLSSWIKKREAPLNNLDEGLQLKKTKTTKSSNIANSVDFEQDLCSIFMWLHF